MPPIWAIIILVILVVVVVGAIRERRRGLKSPADPEYSADRAAAETRAQMRGHQGHLGG